MAEPVQLLVHRGTVLRAYPAQSGPIITPATDDEIMAQPCVISAIAEFRATLANERGDGPPPSEGWMPSGPDWVGWQKGEYRVELTGNGWSLIRKYEHCTKVVGGFSFARDAMKATDAVKGTTCV